MQKGKKHVCVLELDWEILEKHINPYVHPATMLPVFEKISLLTVDAISYSLCSFAGAP